ncbi:MAG: serine kinase [Steroidobacteraceae bacterium]
MSRRTLAQLSEPPPDPFHERRRPAFQAHLQVLGGRFQFETDNSRLLRIVQLAYGGLPPHKLAGAVPRFRVRLALASTKQSDEILSKDEPPRVSPLSGGGLLCGVMRTSNFVALRPEQRSALLVVSQDMLRFSYHIRYEMLEFAVYVLAARVQALVPLHAACVGRDGRGILLLGPSGSGKSTLTLHCLLQGLEFLAEDSVLVRPQGLLATGVANFLHVRPDSLRFLANAGRGIVHQASVIRRRSGVEKFEIDLRRPQYRLAPAPLRIGAVIFVSARNAGKRQLLQPLRSAAAIAQLARGQRYAAHQPGWSAFVRDVSALPAFELHRGRHPLEGVEALRGLLLTLPPGVRDKG